MTRDELLELIAEVQAHQSELEGVEVKSAREGTPKRLYASLSAFANRTGGGVILLGLDEGRGFAVAGVGNAHRILEEVGSLASSEMEPALRPDFTVEKVEGETVVAIEVDEIPPERRPCYYKPQTLQRGAYIRVGNTNRRMSDYEVFGYASARTQPRDDEQPIERATVEDLDSAALEGYFAALRRNRPDAAFLNASLEEVLERLSIVRRDADDLRPTLAGLLAFGKYPQEFEPQLVVTFVQFYGTTESEKTPRGERFLDNRKFEGALPKMVDGAVSHVMASIRKSSLIEGLFRRDIPEYPEEAVREAIVNAVAHRDYSQFVRGSYVQIRLFADRLEVQSPGGLYGNVTEENIEQEQSTRNRILMRMLEDLHIVENRGSGIQAMIRAMREANLEPPGFQDKRSSFWLILRSHTLMNPVAVEWLNQFADLPLNDSQRVALAYLRLNERITNSDYRRLNHVDPLAATRELQRLVQAGLIVQHGTRRWTYYTLAVPSDARPSADSGTGEERVLTHVRHHGGITNSECRELLGLTRSRAHSLLKRMCDRGLLQMVGERKGARYVLP